MPDKCHTLSRALSPAQEFPPIMKENPVARWWRTRQNAENQASRPTTAPEPKPNPTPEPIQVELIDPEDFVGSDSRQNERLVREGFLGQSQALPAATCPWPRKSSPPTSACSTSKTPLWVKGTVAAALAYFILPIDAIPDVLPIVGLNDDAAVITAALTAISAYITEDHHQKAYDWLRIEQVVTSTSKTKAQTVPGGS